MLAYLVNFMNVFVPVALVAGTLLALWRPADGKPGARPLAGALVAGVLGGIALYLACRHRGVLTAARSSLEGAAVLAALLNAALFPLARGRAAGLLGRGAALLFCGVLAAAAGASCAGFAAEQTMTSASVLNTELILNLGGILAGLLLAASLVPLTAYLGGKAGRRVALSVLLLASLPLVLQWSGDLLLGLMRLELVELTSLRVSVVAKIGKYAKLAPYYHLALIGWLALACFLGRTRFSREALAGLEPAPRRKARGAVLCELRWLRLTLGFLVLASSLFLYHDLYASRPPRISTPLRLTPDQAGNIRVRLEDLADGNLHRYAYLTDDGHVVRFFLINRTGGRKIGVVYDACMMCGDLGYLQEKNEVICLACNVRIHIPSIGKPGGCNPIPLAHRLEGGEVVVSAEELDKGARYFSEVVTVKVKDPVTGKELVSRDAQHRYEYKGRSYFFEGERSLEQFKADPDRYTGQRQSRYFRAQGYQGA